MKGPQREDPFAKCYYIQMEAETGPAARPLIVSSASQEDPSLGTTHCERNLLLGIAHGEGIHLSGCNELQYERNLLVRILSSPFAMFNQIVKY